MFFPRTIATISLLAFNSPFKREGIVSGVPSCRTGFLKNTSEATFSVYRRSLSEESHIRLNQRWKSLFCSEWKWWMYMKDIFPQSAAWSLCSCREKRYLKKKKREWQNDRSLIDKPFYCHWQAAFHYPHMPPAHPYSQRILWPHRSPSLIRFFWKKEKNKQTKGMFLHVGPARQSMHGHISWAGIYNKEIMVVVLIGWRIEPDVWRRLLRCGWRQRRLTDAKTAKHSAAFHCRSLFFLLCLL